PASHHSIVPLGQCEQSTASLVPTWAASSASNASHSFARMYQPEFIARMPASRTSSFTKTRESGTFFILFDRGLLGEVDPLSVARRFHRRFHYSHGCHSIRAINQRPASRFIPSEKGRQL